MYVLIVDPDPEDVELFCEAVLHVNPSIGCVFAKDGKEAFDILQSGKEKPSLIFTDVDMPNMDGFQLLQSLKRDTALTDIPIIIYTSLTHVFKENNMVAVNEIGMDLGASTCISKPTSFDKLIEVVKLSVESYKSTN